MHPPKIDLAGKKFGMQTVIRFIGGRHCLAVCSPKRAEAQRRK
jgi:hypothetical protein